MMGRVILHGSVATVDAAARIADEVSERMLADANGASVEHVHVGSGWERRVLDVRGRVLGRVMVRGSIDGMALCAAWERPTLSERARDAVSWLRARWRSHAVLPSRKADT